MKSACKLLPALLIWLYAVQGEGGELLGSISDETASVADRKPAAAAEKNKITYRVICPADGEILPECGQPPVDDFFEAGQAPESAEKPVIAEGREKPAEQADQDLPQTGTEPIAIKKAAALKKPTKKPAKKARKRVKARGR